MTSTRFLRHGCALFALALAAPAALHAQEVTGTIRGDVTDDAGNPIANATVTVTHVPSGTRSVQTTGADGGFSATNLRIGGPFSVEVAAPGFDAATSTIQSIAAGQPQRVGVFLAPAGQTIAVTGTRQARSSITLATGPATSLDASDIGRVATINRDIRSLANRDPFVTLDSTNGTGAISIAGQNNRFNRITVDGIGFGDPFGLEAGGLASARGPVPLDAIGEFTVQVAPADIQQGGFQGGAVNTVLKSGGNSFTGTGFYSYSADELAGDRTRNRTVPREFSSRIMGAQLTGPIVPDKLFFAVTWERVRNSTPALTGPTGEGFANQLPVTRPQIETVRGIAQSVYSYDALDVATAVPEKDDKVAAKIDWNIADNHRAAFTYIYAKGNILAGQTGDNEINQTNPTLALQSNNYDQGSVNHYGVFQLNSDWSDSFSTQARVSYNDYERLQVPYNGRDFGQFQVCLVDGAPPLPGGIGATPPALVCPGGTGRVQFGPDISRQANQLFVKTLGIELQAQIRKNGHNVKIIAERRQQDIENLFAQRVSGAFYFDSIADLRARRANELDYAVPLLGGIDTVTANFDIVNYTFGVQDQWEASDSLDVIYGFRYDLYDSGATPLFNQNFLNRFGFANTETLKGRGIFQPRFGLTWRASDRLRVSGSAGLFAGGSPNVWISNSYSNPGPALGRVQVRRTDTGAFTISGVPVDTATAQIIGAAALNNVSGGPGIPQSLDDLIRTGGSALSPTNAISRDFRIPSQWRIAGSADYSADLGFLGDEWNLGVDVVYSRVKDALTWTDLRSVPNVLQATLPDGRRRFQGLVTQGDTNTDILLTNTDQGHSWNIVGSVDKDFDSGFSIGASYTFQRAKDQNPGTSSVAFSNYAQAAYADPDFAAYGTSIYQIDNTLRLRLSFSREFIPNAATTFEAFFTSRSGQRFSYTFADLTPGRSAIFGTTGQNNRYLLYVPTGPEDRRVTFGSSTVGGVVQTAAQAEALFNQIVANSALEDYRGQIAPKNIGQSPRFNKLDLSFRQQVPFFFNSRFEAFADIENVLNLINKDWGSLRQVAFPYLGTTVNVACGTVNTVGGTTTVTPVTLPTQRCDGYLYSNVRAPAETLFVNQSLWQLRVGARFSF